MSLRLIYTLAFFAVCGLLTTSIYLQVFLQIIPCPLCILQRLTFCLLALFFLLGALFAKSRDVNIFLALLSSLTSVLGLFLTSKNIWLQHFPSSVSTECGVSIQYMLQTFSFTEVLQKMLAGSTDCSQRGWEFFHLNIAEWGFVWFFIFFIMSVYLMLRKR